MHSKAQQGSGTHEEEAHLRYGLVALAAGAKVRRVAPAHIHAELVASDTTASPLSTTEAPLPCLRPCVTRACVPAATIKHPCETAYNLNCDPDDTASQLTAPIIGLAVIVGLIFLTLFCFSSIPR